MARTTDLITAYVKRATPEMKEVLKGAWCQYIVNQRKGTPYLVLPKALADDMGNDAVLEIANRFSVLAVATIELRYDPRINTVYIGPRKCLPIHPLVATLATVDYDPGTMKVPDMTGSLPRNQAKPSFAKPVKATKTANCFMLYRKDKQEELRLTYPAMLCKDLSKVIGQMWANETSEVKHIYQVKAQELKPPVQQAPYRGERALVVMNLPNGPHVAFAPLAAQVTPPVTQAAPAAMQVAPATVQAAAPVAVAIQPSSANVNGTSSGSTSAAAGNGHNA